MSHLGLLLVCLAVLGECGYNTISGTTLISMNSITLNWAAAHLVRLDLEGNPVVNLPSLQLYSSERATYMVLKAMAFYGPALLRTALGPNSALRKAAPGTGQAKVIYEFIEINSTVKKPIKSWTLRFSDNMYKAVDLLAVYDNKDFVVNNPVTLTTWNTLQSEFLPQWPY